MNFNSTVGTIADGEISTDATDFIMQYYGIWIYSAGIFMLLILLLLVFLPLTVTIRNGWTRESVPLILVQPPSLDDVIASENPESGNSRNTSRIINDTNKTKPELEMPLLPKTAQNDANDHAAMTQLNGKLSMSCEVFENAIDEP